MTNNPEIRVFSTAGTEADNDKLWKKTVDDTLLTKANIDLTNLSTIGQAKFNSKASVSLDNLNTAGELRFTNKASIDLDNLSPAGEARIASAGGGANVSLSNLDATGEARFTAKSNIDLDNISSAGVAVIQSYATGGANTDLSNLSATGEARFTNKANISLDNLNSTGEARFTAKLDKNYISNCILEAPNGVVTYSGAVVTVKAGVKVLIPNGRNADGTLKSIEVTVAADNSLTNTSVSRQIMLFVNSSGLIYRRGSDVNVTTYLTRPSSAKSAYELAFIVDENQWIQSEATTAWTLTLYLCPVAIGYTDASSNITSLRTFNPVNLLKTSDIDWLSGLGMASEKKVTLTIGASGASYTAPANGYYVFLKSTNNVNQFIALNKSINGILFSSYVMHSLSSAGIRTWLPAKEGEVITIEYSAGGSGSLTFFYAEGAQ